MTSPGERERGARRPAAGIAIAVLLGLYECREDTDEDMLLVQMGLPVLQSRFYVELLSAPVE